LVGPGSVTEAEVRDDGRLLGAAHVHQELALAEVAVAFRRDATWQPFVSIGAGAHQVRVRGVPGAPIFTAREDTSRALALVQGAGLAFRFSNRAALTVEAQLLESFPSTKIAVVDQQAARVGPVGVVVALGLATRF
jgi:hypothetical protein